MNIDNGIIRLEFEPNHGSLVQISDLSQNLQVLSDPREGRLFRVFTQDDEAWIDRCPKSPRWRDTG